MLYDKLQLSVSAPIHPCAVADCCSAIGFGYNAVRYGMSPRADLRLIGALAMVQTYHQEGGQEDSGESPDGSPPP